MLCQERLREVADSDNLLFNVGIKANQPTLLVVSWNTLTAEEPVSTCIFPIFLATCDPLFSPRRLVLHPRCPSGVIWTPMQVAGRIIKPQQECGTVSIFQSI